MLPTLNDGDIVLVRKHVEGFNRGDIVIFRHPDDQSVTIVKRIIGLPGESVEIRDGRVFINGSVLDEPYLATANLNREQMNLTIIPDLSFFVLGDNRRNSSDSRYWGVLPKKLIRGKAVLW
jgi:signal peptidase I